MFGIDSADSADLKRAYITNMLHNSTGAGVRGWRRNCAGGLTLWN
jgi:hypothetical protein